MSGWGGTILMLLVVATAGAILKFIASFIAANEGTVAGEVARGSTCGAAAIALLILGPIDDDYGSWWGWFRWVAIAALVLTTVYSAIIVWRRSRSSP